MTVHAAASISAAIAVAVTLFDAAPVAEAASAPSHTVHGAPTTRRVAPGRSTQTSRHQHHMHSTKGATTSTEASTRHTKHPSKPHDHGKSQDDGKSGKVLGAPSAATGPGNLQGKLPLYKPVANTFRQRGRIGVPDGLQPKYYLPKQPPEGTMGRLTPFVQRYWRRDFFWVAVAGLGYLTVPEDYYESFFTLVDGAEPDYDGAIGLLSLAAVRDEDIDRVHYPMPPGVGYRYQANVAPANVANPGGKLPVFAEMAGDTTRLGRLGVPANLRPRITLLSTPVGSIHDRLLAFVQRPWKGTFVWVAIAELGYVTVPEANYGRFLELVIGTQPNYEAVVGLLSAAAVHDEDQDREHDPKPPDAAYRYEAKTAPTEPLAGAAACSFEPFVERKWNGSFVWVLIPQTGNVTVPDDFFDRFSTPASKEPANYAEACAVLEEAAATDTIVAAIPAAEPGAQSASREVCGLEPFIERKWNRPYVWVLIPQTGNVTVPEDLYDRFYTLVSSEPPNYRVACTLLTAAAAADTVAVASNDN
jgi:hypothetical protein